MDHNSIKKHKVLITGGHLSPALATIEEFQKNNWEIVFVGRKFHTSGALSDEFQIITDMGIQFLPLTTGKLHRHSLLAAIGSLTRTPVGLSQSLLYLKKHQPQVVMSFGGYLSVPVILAASLLKIPSITHEQTRAAGLANRINAKFATKVAISFPESASFFPQNKLCMTGNPIRLQALAINQQLPEIAYLPHEQTIYVTGGNQGAREINLMIFAMLQQITEKYNLIHSIGTINNDDWQHAQELKHNLPNPASYIPARYITPEYIGSVFSKADLVISRTGANTCTELAHLGKACLLIPLPSGQKNEQLQNAQLLERLGIGEIHLQHTLTAGSLFEHSERMLTHPEHYKVDQHARDTYFPADAANKLVTLAAQLCQKQ